MNTYINPNSIPSGSITKDMLDDDVVSSLENEATTGTPGLMSAKDKTKLDGLATVATSGSYNDLSDKPDFTIPEASTKEPGLLSANDKIKLDNLKKVATSGSYNDLSNKPTIQDTTYAPATSSTAGLMSSDDKVKLDGFQSATNYATKEYVNEQIGNINAILEEIINM